MPPTSRSSVLPLAVCLTASLAIFFMGQMLPLDPYTAQVFLSAGAAGLISCLGLSEVYRQRSENEAFQLREISTIDELTGAGNRRYFETEVKRRVGQFRYYHSRCALMLLDIDHFKFINDRHGHWLGDEVLRQVCSSIIRHIRDVDILFRIGGEEFVIVLPETSLYAATIAAERVKKAVEMTEIKHNNETISVTVSIGVTEIADNDCMESLVVRADKAMYAAKAAGRNSVYVAEKGNSSVPFILAPLYLSKYEQDLERPINPATIMIANPLSSRSVRKAQQA